MQFDEEYGKEKAHIMRKLLERIVADIDFDIEHWSIDGVLNGIEYNRNNNLKNKENFHRAYGHWELKEHELADIIGTAIGRAYSDRFEDNYEIQD